MNENKKYFYLDLLRIYAIFCVIMLHIAMPFLESVERYGTRIWHVANVLNTFSRSGVPLFFMISGYLLLCNPKTAEIGSFYKKRLSKIAVPFLVWNVIYYIAYTLMENRNLSVAEFFQQMLVSGTSYHFWYVYTLIIIYLFMPFLKRILDGLEQKWCWVLLIISGIKTTIVPFIHAITSIEIYMFDNLMLGYVGYVLLGYILGRFEYSQKQNIVFYCVGIIGACITTYGNYAMSDGGKNFVFNGGYQLGHFMLAAGIFVLFKNFKTTSGKAAKVAGTLSGITFGMYLVHPMTVSLVYKIVSPQLRPFIYIFVMFGLTVIVSAGITYLLSKIKFINKILL